MHREAKSKSKGKAGGSAPKRDTPASYSKRTNTLFFFVKVWTPKGSCVTLWMPGVPESRGKKLLQSLVAESGKKKDLKGDLFNGRFPFMSRDMQGSTADVLLAKFPVDPSQPNR